MAINEQIIKGRKFRKCIDVANKIWLRISFWTAASDVEFEDGKTLEQKLGSINGITDSLGSNDLKTALSAKAGKILNDKIEDVSKKLLEIVAKLSGLSFKVLTQEQYDTLTNKDEKTLYFIYSN